MAVHYKFKNTKECEWIKLDAPKISVKDLKKAIMEEKRLNKYSTDLQILNDQTKEVYHNEDECIEKHSSVIVCRIPVALGNKKKSWKRSHSPPSIDSASAQPSFTSSLKNIVHDNNLATSNLSEEEKIRQIISESTLDYDPSKYPKRRNTSGPPPPSYSCHICSSPYHWITDCPIKHLNIKRSTGIPQSFLEVVNGPNHKGVRRTVSGLFVVPKIDKEAYQAKKKEIPPFAREVDLESQQYPECVLCPLCKNLMVDSVIMSCCGNSSCDDCIRQLLLASENPTCPLCKTKDVSPSKLVPNLQLRQHVARFGC